MRKLIAEIAVVSIALGNGIALLPLFSTAQVAPPEFRTIDGSGNNVAHPQQGSAGTQLRRDTTASYADGLNSPSGTNRPNARAVSYGIMGNGGDTIDERGLSDMTWTWGQFVDHDLDLSDPAVPDEPFPIAIPTGDPFFDPLSTGTKTMPLSRSKYDTSTGINGPRQQINSITSYVDGSQVYGSDPVRAAALRTFVGGKLKTSDGNLLPFNTNHLPNAMSTSASFFLAGDVRSNEQPSLTVMHTLFVREHNRLADEIAASNPGMNDEEIYQRARRIVGAEIQEITYSEWIPALFGPNALPAYAGYDPNVDASVENAFANAGFRIGHTMVSQVLQRLNEDGSVIPQGNLSLQQSFFNPTAVTQAGIDPILRGISATTMQKIDSHMINDLCNFLFGPPGSGGLDLASLNIQRGRDHGLPSYNQARRDYGLTPRTSFNEITSDADVAQRLSTVYGGDIEKVDMWVGGISEDHVAGGSVGELFRAVILDQFRHGRDGDRLWYQRSLDTDELADVEGLTLADVIRRNTGIGWIQDDVFFAADRSGRTFADMEASLQGASPTFGPQFTLHAGLRDNGPSDSTQAVLRITLPASVSYDQQAGDPHCTLDVQANVLTCTPPDGALGTGSSAEFSLPLAADETLCSSTVTFVAAADSSQDDNASANTVVRLPVYIGCPTEGQVQLHTDLSGSDRIFRGNDISYVLNVTNDGPSTATNVRATMPLGGLALSTTGNPGECTQVGSDVVCTGFNLTAGSSRAFSLKVATTLESQCPQTVTTHAVSASDASDFYAADDRSQDVSTRIECEPVADVGITAFTGPNNQVRGATFVYTAIAKNYGPATASNVVVSIGLPAGVTFQPSSPGCVQAGANVECTVPSLDVNATKAFDIAFATLPGFDCGGTVTTSASVRASERDNEPANNQGNTVVTGITCEQTGKPNGDDGTHNQTGNTAETQEKILSHSHKGHGTTEAAMVMAFLAHNHNVQVTDNYGQDQADAHVVGHFAFAADATRVFALKMDPFGLRGRQVAYAPYTDDELSVICGMKDYLHQDAHIVRMGDMMPWVIEKLSAMLHRDPADIKAAMEGEATCSK
ncbi:MAG TPA: peroxidase family protein [Candidatus Peribacteria bacterium]|nr:peroxidase family protein [Candidatus Peribacteria bacterium]